jgi:hypothetical protein
MCQSYARRLQQETNKFTKRTKITGACIKAMLGSWNDKIIRILKEHRWSI